MLFRMRQAIRRWLRPKEPKTPRLGARPKLLLAKFGFDMRSDYEHVVQEPLPAELQSLVEQLPGARDRDVIDLSSYRPSERERAGKNPPREPGAERGA